MAKCPFLVVAFTWDIDGYCWGLMGGFVGNEFVELPSGQRLQFAMEIHHLEGW